MRDISKLNINEAYTVKVIGGKQFLFIGGVKLPHQMNTIIEQHAEDAQIGMAVATVKFLVRLEDTK